MKHLKQKTTTNYNKFSYLPMNREVQAAHVDKMVLSLRKIGCIRDVIVAETNLIEGVQKTYIVDGQHLYNALVREKAPISYRTVKVKTEKDLINIMASLNNTSKSWGLLDYVNAYKFVNNDYMKLLRYINMYNLEPSMIAILSYDNLKRYSSVGSIIKSGDFKITNPNIELMCKQFSDIFLKIGKADRWVKFNFLYVFINKHENYNHDATLINLEKHIGFVKAMADAKEARDFISSKIFK